MAVSARVRGSLTSAVVDELKSFRQERQMTQKDLAQRAGLPANTYNLIENRKRPIDIEQLNRLADGLGITSYELLLSAEIRITAVENPIGLSNREVEVVRAVLHSGSKTAAAKSLFISLGTINTHLTRVRQKFYRALHPVPTRTALTVAALRQGIIRFSDFP